MCFAAARRYFSPDPLPQATTDSRLKVLYAALILVILAVVVAVTLAYTKVEPFYNYLEGSRLTQWHMITLYLLATPPLMVFSYLLLRTPAPPLMPGLAAVAPPLPAAPVLAPRHAMPFPRPPDPGPVPGGVSGREAADWYGRFPGPPPAARPPGVAPPPIRVGESSAMPAPRATPSGAPVFDPRGGELHLGLPQVINPHASHRNEDFFA